MKIFSYRLLIVLAVLLMLLTACNMDGGTESPPSNNLLPAPASSTTTDFPAPNDYSNPLPTQEACYFTNDISLPINRDICTSTGDLKLISVDNKPHSCTFTGTSRVTKSISQGQSSSASFKLGKGSYTLRCDNLPKIIKVNVQ